MKVGIFGAGRYGKMLYHFMKNAGAKIDFFCQTYCEEKKYYDGVEIIDTECLKKKQDEMIVLIAIADKQMSKSVMRRLLSLNKNIHIYEFGNFISENIDKMESGKTHYCNICGSNVEEFGQAVFSSSELFEKHHVSGGGNVRENIVCPICKSIDRMRWQYWVMGRYTKIFSEKCSVLHIAPEYGISECIQANDLCDYYSGDINGRAMHIVDVTNLQFKDGFFDYIIMNHVLEHIIDEKKTISEIKRVLKPSGKIILSFPICTDMDTYENPNIKTPQDRLREFGQEDHVRLYGKDYKKRLEKYGLHIMVYSPQNECSKTEIVKYGFSEDDVLMICNIAHRS